MVTSTHVMVARVFDRAKSVRHRSPCLIATAGRPKRKVRTATGQLQPRRVWYVVPVNSGKQYWYSSPINTAFQITGKQLFNERLRVWEPYGHSLLDTSSANRTIRLGSWNSGSGFNPRLTHQSQHKSQSVPRERGSLTAPARLRCLPRLQRGDATQ